ncbi:MAG: hypothetical protein K0B81_00590 [Candidatus Cloacimonetes bacterium]|nr:hypothetical protein [Candidatus Cloacimonadota bacterium]
MSKFKEIDLTSQKKYSLSVRESKVDKSLFYRTGRTNELSSFVSRLPDILQAKGLKELLDKCYIAHKEGKPVIVALGGHIIKCGLSPLLNELIDQRIISCLAGNGAVAIHDFELALSGKTSEDVASALEDGTFGMAQETGELINKAITTAAVEKLGFGEGLGIFIEQYKPPNKSLSILANAYNKDIPFTVHVALGTDIIHQHKEADGAAIGECTLRDFRIFCEQVKGLNDGGVFLNLGSAVIMPEVFLKAITVVRNLGYSLNNFTTAVFDMNLHYRPRINVVERPTSKGGKGYYFVGHHEIMIPFFFAVLQERIHKNA